MFLPWNISFKIILTIHWLLIRRISSISFQKSFLRVSLVHLGMKFAKRVYIYKTMIIVSWPCLPSPVVFWKLRNFLRTIDSIDSKLRKASITLQQQQMYMYSYALQLWQWYINDSEFHSLNCNKVGKIAYTKLHTVSSSKHYLYSYSPWCKRALGSLHCAMTVHNSQHVKLQIGQKHSVFLLWTKITFSKKPTLIKTKCSFNGSDFKGYKGPKA